jgi:hypothetical protein
MASTITKMYGLKIRNKPPARCWRSPWKAAAYAGFFFDFATRTRLDDEDDEDDEDEDDDEEDDDEEDVLVEVPASSSSSCR